MAIFNIITKRDLNIKTDFIEVLKYAILETNTGGYYLQMKLKNISNSIIESFELVYSIDGIITIYHFDNNIEPMTEFFDKNLIKINGIDFKFILFQNVKTKQSTDLIKKRLELINLEEEKLKRLIESEDSKKSESIYDYTVLESNDTNDEIVNNSLSNNDLDYSKNKTELIQNLDDIFIEKSNDYFKKTELKTRQLNIELEKQKLLEQQYEEMTSESNSINNACINTRIENPNYDKVIAELNAKIEAKEKAKHNGPSKKIIVESDRINYLFFIIAFINVIMTIACSVYFINHIDNYYDNLKSFFIIAIIIFLGLYISALVMQIKYQKNKKYNYTLPAILLGISIMVCSIYTEISRFIIFTEKTNYLECLTFEPFLFIPYVISFTVALVFRKMFKINYVLIFSTLLLIGMTILTGIGLFV